jgi:flagellar biosynthetic protein FliS
MTAGYDTYRSQKSAHGGSTALSVAQLFDVIAATAREAKKAIENEDIEARFAATDRGSAIISGLERALQGDTLEEKEMAETLKDFYQVLRALIWQIDSKNDVAACDSLERTALQMAEGWRDVDTKVLQQMVEGHSQVETTQEAETKSQNHTEGNSSPQIENNIIV